MVKREVVERLRCEGIEEESFGAATLLSVSRLATCEVEPIQEDDWEIGGDG